MHLKTDFFSPRNGGAFAVYKPVFRREGRTALVSRKKFWRENSNELTCIVPGTPQYPGPPSPSADGPWAGVPHLDEIAHHGAVEPEAGVPHLDELAHHGADRPGAGVQHLDELDHHGADGHGAGVPHLDELARDSVFYHEIEEKSLSTSL